jgi:hypothetical protein
MTPEISEKLIKIMAWCWDLGVDVAFNSVIYKGEGSIERWPRLTFTKGNRHQDLVGVDFDDLLLHFESKVRHIAISLCIPELKL